jgi:uncharacterized protein (DUF1778 family)
MKSASNLLQNKEAQIIKLSREESEQFAKALAEPPAPKLTLQRAIERSRTILVDRTGH